MILFLFWISTLFIVYTYLLYPMLIVMASRLKRGQPSPADDSTSYPSLTMIIIAFNEESKILDKLENCRTLDYPVDLFNIIVSSDGSTDGTADILRNQDDILFIEDRVNRGKPYQINNAVKHCTSELIVFSDTRQMYEPDALRKLARNFADPEVGAVSGELTFISATDMTERNVGLYWRYEKILRNAESTVDSTLGVTGAIYAIRRSLIEPIPDDTILDDIEIPLRAFKKGYRVIFDGEAVAYDTASAEVEAEFRRKVRTLAGNFQLFDRNPWLLNPLSNRIFWQSTSHKLFRLFVPYFMILALVTSFMAEGPFYGSMFWAQILFYTLGLLGLLSSRLRKNRMINFFLVFISLNTAAIFALLLYSSGKADAKWKK